MLLEGFQLDGKVAVVTGASRRLGQAAAIGFAGAGADVALVASSSTAETAREISRLSRRVCQVLVEPKSASRVVGAVVGEPGSIDILLNNAGIIRRAPVLKFNDPQKAVDHGAAHEALATTTPGDTSMVTRKEVEKTMSEGSTWMQL